MKVSNMSSDVGDHTPLYNPEQYLFLPDIVVNAVSISNEVIAGKKEARGAHFLANGSILYLEYFGVLSFPMDLKLYHTTTRFALSP